MLVVIIGSRTVDIDTDFVRYIHQDTFKCNQKFLMRNLISSKVSYSLKICTKYAPNVDHLCRRR